MTTAPSPAVIEAADRLLGWRGVSVVGAKDVLCWRYDERRHGIAFQGDALSLQNRSVQQNFPNCRYELDLSMQRALGLPAAMRGSGPEQQFMSSDDVHISELLDGVQHAVQEATGLGDDSCFVTLMPKEGAPWSPHNSPTEWWSAKKRRLFTTAQPPWLVDVEGQVGADVCLVTQTIEGCGAGALAGSIEGDRGGAFLVAHCTSLEPHVDPLARAKAVARCGGLLFPSISVSRVPATQFGRLVLLFDIGVVMQNVRPYKAKRRGAWPVTIYDTDAWTAGTREIVKEGSIELFQELCGSPDLDWMYKQGLWTLGPPFRVDHGEVVGSTKQLRSALKRKDRWWPRDKAWGPLERPENISELYPILEAKANGILGMNCVALAVTDDQDPKLAKKVLSTMGYRGKLLIVPWTGEGVDALWSWAWQVRDVVLGEAEKRGMIAGLEAG